MHCFAGCVQRCVWATQSVNWYRKFAACHKRLSTAISKRIQIMILFKNELLTNGRKRIWWKTMPYVYSNSFLKHVIRVKRVIIVKDTYSTWNILRNYIRLPLFQVRWANTTCINKHVIFRAESNTVLSLSFCVQATSASLTPSDQSDFRAKEPRRNKMENTLNSVALLTPASALYTITSHFYTPTYVPRGVAGNQQVDDNNNNLS
jgi:hypothetical protein